MILVADASALIDLATCDSPALREGIFGLIPRVAPLIKQISTSSDYMSENLIRAVLELADETGERG